MRRLLFILACGGLAVGAWGCAQQNEAITATPSPDELPNVPGAHHLPIQCSVAVEGRRDEPRLPMVPTFVEPPLTEEEKAALGLDEPQIKLLPYELTLRSPRALVYWYVGGAEVGVDGRGGAMVGRDIPTSVSGVNTEMLTLYGTDGVTRNVAGVMTPRSPTGTAGPEDGVQVGTDVSRQVGFRQPRREK